MGESLGLAVWNTDQAGPLQTGPYPGSHWGPGGHPKPRPPQYARNGTAEVLPSFHPADCQVRAKGVANCPNTVSHPWLKQELTDALASIPKPSPVLEPEANLALWEMWYEELSAANIGC